MVVLIEGNSKDIIEMSSLAESVDIVAYNIPDEIIRDYEENPSVLQIEYVDGNLSLKLKKEGESVLSILNTLEEAGVTPVSVQSKKPSLNDVFLEITGKDLRDHA